MLGLVAASVLAWLIVVMLCILVWQLVAQHGALLLRVETLERMAGNSYPANTAAPHTSSGPQTIGTMGRPTGGALPDFSLPDLQGTNMRLSQWRGERVLLIFFDPESGYCLQMLPALAQLQRDSDPKPVVISRGDPDLNRTLFHEHAEAVTVLLQEDEEVASLYHVHGTPSAYLVDAEGRLERPLAVGSEAVLALTVVHKKGGQSEAASLHMDDALVTPSALVTPIVAKSRLIRNGLPAGTTAPQFSLPLLTGGEVSLREYSGREVLLIFSDVGCAPCQELAPKLERIHRSASGQSLLMISRGSLEANQAKATELGLTFPIALQRHWEISRLYGMFATPIGYRIDRDGIVAKSVAVGADAILVLAGS